MANYTVIGLMFGDEGKGSVVDFLARETKAKLVCRFNGGAQARHHVVDGNREHGFAQFGSGTLAGVPTLLSRHVLVNPLSMDIEANRLVEIGLDQKKLWDGMYVDERCRVTTPYHRALNRLRELCRADGRHGSCGMGVGETVSDYMKHEDKRILVRDLKEPHLKKLLLECRERCLRTIMKLPGLNPVAETQAGNRELSTFKVHVERVLESWASWVNKAQILTPTQSMALLQNGATIFEGAQGVLLDQDYGFYPYNTWSNCTATNVVDLCRDAVIPFLPTTIGVIRPYCTRHGAGPFPTFSEALTDALPEKHNGANAYQGDFRLGWFDLAAMNYALDCCNKMVDFIAITNMDRLSELKNALFCDGYEDFTLRVPESLREAEAQTKAFSKAIPKYLPLESLGERVMHTSKIKLKLVSYGPAADSKILSDSPVDDFISGRAGVLSFAA